MSDSRRSKFVDQIFGNCKEFALNQLPTKADVIKSILYYRRSVKNQNTSIRPFIKKTIERVKLVWSKTDVKIKHDSSIERLASRVFDKYMTIIHHKNRQSFSKKSNVFRTEMKRSLFDHANVKTIVIALMLRKYFQTKDHS